jgi:hypothetical protein
VLSSNIGGAATLIGDPPNIIIGSRAGLSFNDFLIHMGPIIVIELIVFTLLLPVLFRGSFTLDPGRVADVMSLNEREAIRDRRLLVKCDAVLLAVLVGFVGHVVLHIEPSVVALLGAGLLVLISGLEPRDYMASVEWETLLFFAGLFVMIGALVKTGVIGNVARFAAEVTGGNAVLAVMLILVVSALLSGVIDNIPYAATMSPLVLELVHTMTDLDHAGALWWSLALGAGLGGNMTAVGQRQRRRAGHRGPRRLTDQLLAVHPHRCAGHRHHDRGGRAVPLAALLRAGVKTPVLGYLDPVDGRVVVVSRSAEPALALIEDKLFTVHVPDFQPVDTRGGGDSMTAGVAAALAQGESTEMALRIGGAAGAVTSPARTRDRQRPDHPSADGAGRAASSP